MSLAAVFIPILFMSGILGRLFREFAVTITTAILISGLVSVTLTPMLCSRFLRVASLAREGPLRPRHGAPLQARCFAPTSGACALVLRHRAGDARACSSSCWRRRSRMFVIDPEGIHPRPGQRFVERQRPGGPGHVVLRHGHVRRTHRATSSTRNPYVDTFFASAPAAASGR